MMGRVLGCVAMMEKGVDEWRSGRTGTHRIALCDVGCSPGAEGFAHIPSLAAVLSGCKMRVGMLDGHSSRDSGRVGSWLLQRVAG